jgi:hypothetical protein
MAKGIFIPADEDRPLEIRNFDGLSDYQTAVGGLIEPMNLDRPSSTLYLNEEGKLIGLPKNRRSTLLLWLHNTRWRGADVLKGDAVLIGSPDDDGETQDVPDELVTLLLHTETYKVEVNTIDDLNTWNGNQMRYGDWQEAYAAGLSLAGRWFAVNHVRVVPA